MSRPRLRFTVLALAGALTLGGAPAALASSAGDQQYTDPLAQGHSGSSGSSSGSSQSSGSSSPASSSSSSGSSASSATPSTGTTLTASTSSSGASVQKGTNPALPYTGFNSDLSAVLGLGLVLSGFGLRRAIRPRRSSGA